MATQYLWYRFVSAVSVHPRTLEQTKKTRILRSNCSGKTNLGLFYMQMSQTSILADCKPSLVRPTWRAHDFGRMQQQNYSEANAFPANTLSAFLQLGWVNFQIAEANANFPSDITQLCWHFAPIQVTTITTKNYAEFFEDFVERVERYHAVWANAVIHN